MLTCLSDPLHDLFRIYPEAEEIFRDVISAANLEKGIKATEFQSKKERILILHHLLTSINGLDREQIRTLADAVLVRRDMTTIMELLKVAEKGFFCLESAAQEHIMSSFGRRSSKISNEEDLWMGALNFASLVSDYHFLKQLKTATLDECLRDSAVDAEETAYACLTTQVDSLVAGFGQQVLSMQKGECDRQLQREISSGELEDRELENLRADFVNQIEDLTRQRSRSYVLYCLEEGRIA